jgi:glycosyltransferase 2 family protein
MAQHGERQQSPPSKVNRRTWITIAIIAIVAIAGVMLVGDIRKVSDRVADFQWWAFAAAIGLALANYVIRFFRWHYYLRRQSVSVPVASSALVFGAGLSLAITPGKLGELIKSLLLHDMHGVAVEKTAPIVVAERVTDLIALLCVALLGVAFYGVATTLVIGASAVIAVGLLLLAWPRPTIWIIEMMTRPKVFRRFREPAKRMYIGLASLCRPVPLLVATAISIPAWLCECVGFAIIINAFPHPHVAVGLATVIYAGTTIAGALSFLPGGLGVTEAGMTFLLVQGSAHLDSGTALAATLLTRLATLWFAVVLGLVMLAAARRRIARLSVKS